MQPFEKLGAFYLGRVLDSGGAPGDAPLLYDARDLTTHAVCMGMTGSGKTGLCLCLLEEAAIDGVPVLAIDPKGDLGNLLLTFPDLRAEDFRPWVEEAEAARKGVTVDELAARTAEAWRQGLAEWGESGERIARLRASAEFSIFTPGSTAGLPLSVLRSLAPPPPALAADAEAMRDRVLATTSGLLGLLGIDADPVRSREHILVATLLEEAWRNGEGMELAALVRLIQTPPFERMGALDLETFFPAKDRLGLAMAVNNLLASPGFAAWLEGEPLDIPRLLWTGEGKPRVSILSIAHLSEAERMFFVTLLLAELVAWMRGQQGTASLRAVLYVDEVLGYLPPVANPPSKLPLLTLLKQARAFGVGVVLATQNPVDLDYKALSNAGTWFLGRLQTERDKARVLEGLEGAAGVSGGAFDRQRMDALLAGLGARVFLMNNVHEDRPVLFQSRWALSFLRGPLTRDQIRTLMSNRQGPPAAAPPAATASILPAPAGSPARPALPAEANEAFVSPTAPPGRGDLLYRPALFGQAKLHFVDARAGVDVWRDVRLLAALDDRAAEEPWPGASDLGEAPRIVRLPETPARCATLPAAAARGSSYAAWGKSLAGYLFRERTLSLWAYPPAKLLSHPNESRADFAARAGLAAREARDLAVTKLRQRYAPRLAALQGRLQRAEQQQQREEAQYQQQAVQTAISLGATVLGALFGRKLASASTLGRATTTARGVGRSAREREDAAHARQEAADVQRELADLQAEFDAEVAELQGAGASVEEDLQPRVLHPRKSDVSVTDVVLLWTPWAVADDGSLQPLF
jgi:hypothetical protein